RAHDYFARADLAEQRLQSLDNAMIAPLLRRPPVASHPPGSEDMHVRGDGRGAVTASEPVDRQHVVVDRVHAEAAELLRDTRGHDTALSQRVYVLERKRSLAVVLVGARGEVPRVLLGELDEARPGRRDGHQLEVHRRPPSRRPVSTTGRGDPVKASVKNA